MTAPLEGLRVADFSELLPGPFLTQCLVELGAEVIKIERPPHGDPLRRSSPGLFAMVNRGKSSRALNLKSEQDRGTALQLVASCDVMVEGFRPGAMERLGLGYEKVATEKPNLVYISLSGYGQSGPLVDAPGHDLNYLALAGITSLCGEPGGPPAHTFGLPVADLGGALYGLSAVMAALFQRERTGRGQHLDLSLTDCLAHWTNARRGPFARLGLQDLADQRRFALTRPAYGVFACSDGAVSVAALETHFWRALVQALPMGRFSDQAFEDLSLRRAETDAINQAIADVLAPLERDAAVALLLKHDVPVSPVLSLAEADESPHFAARGLTHRTDAGSTVPFPVRLTDMPCSPTRAPVLGQTVKEGV